MSTGPRTALRSIPARPTPNPRVYAYDLDSPELPASTRMLLALARFGKPMYAGTVPPAVKARRRAADKVARASRRANR